MQPHLRYVYVLRDHRLMRRLPASIALVPTELVEMTEFAIDEVGRFPEYQEISRIARELLTHLNSSSALARISEANRPGASSQLVQSVIREFATSLGFVDESRGLFGEYETSGLRPDYFLRVGASGVLLEVERGKTTINNMDFLDFWKCHLCGAANYLFLLVPKALRQNDTMTPRNEYKLVARRLGTFFVPRNYTNVRALFLFGY